MLQGASPRSLPPRLAVTATSASASIVCNGEGECWHVQDIINMIRLLAWSSIPTIGVGRRRPYRGTNMKAAVIGRAASGSRSRTGTLF